MSQEDRTVETNAASRDHLLEENRRLAQRYLELESASRKQVEKLRAANAALTRSAPDLRILLENAAIGFALIDLNLRVASANKVLSDILGRRQEELPGLSFANFIYVGKLPAFSRLTSPYAGRAGSADTIELIGRDGSLLPCRITASEWRDDAGALQGYFLLIVEIGAELAAAGRLREVEEVMVEAEKSRNLFLDVMSRELRTPAGGIVGMARMLMDAGLSDRQKELAGVIHSSASSLVALVDDLMDVVRSHIGETSSAPQPVCPHLLARGVASMFAVRAEEKGLDLRLHLAESVPDRVLADPHLLRRVLVHLLDNAMKFTERGHVALSVDVVGERLRFMVSDTGIGIDPEAEKYLVGSESLHDTPASRRHGGIGMGLALCRRLVSLMGGAIDYDSAPGGGSEFHFSIPLTPTDAPPEDALEPPPEAVHLPPLSILIADANPLSGRLIRAYLNFDGHTLTEADNGLDAADKCRQGDFDLAILDLNLPKLDGLQTLRLIREGEKSGTAKRLPVLILAPPGQMREEQYYERCGADGVVTKPVQPVELMTKAARAARVRPLAVARPSARSQYRARCGGSSLRRLDGSHLVNLRQMMPEEQFTGILRLFMEDAVPDLVELRVLAGQPAPDRERLAFAAAKIRGMAAYLGFSALADVLARLEGGARGGEEVRKLADELQMVTDDSLEELKRILPEAFGVISDMKAPGTGADDSLET